MKIDVLANDGSPLGVTSKTIWGDSWRIGTGGSEMAILTLCERWTKDGHEVCFYNDPRERDASPFEQRTINEFHPLNDRDILIIFRSPNPRAVGAVGYKIWLSFDQFTQGSFKEFSRHVDRIVVISEYHKKYFEDNYQIYDTEVIDLPVRCQDFENMELNKVQHRMLYTSVPDRGLQHLWVMWPIIKRDIPDATLHITSDYRLWGLPDAQNQRHRLQWMKYDGIKFLGAIPRERLLQEQAEAELLLYPSLYDTAELFCISVAEAQAMGVYPITSSWGALETTNMGTVIPGKANTVSFREQFIEEVKYLCANPSELREQAHTLTLKAHERFCPENITKQWETKIFT